MVLVFALQPMQYDLWLNPWKSGEMKGFLDSKRKLKEFLEVTFFPVLKSPLFCQRFLPNWLYHRNVWCYGYSFLGSFLGRRSYKGRALEPSDFYEGLKEDLSRYDHHRFIYDVRLEGIIFRSEPNLINCHRTVKLYRS